VQYGLHNYRWGSKEVSKKIDIPFYLLSLVCSQGIHWDRAFFTLLQSAGRVPELLKIKQNIRRDYESLEKERVRNIPSNENQALNYAQILVGFIPVIYSAADFTDAAWLQV
jgi:hypothetical protein